MRDVVTAGKWEHDDATMVYVYIGKRNNDHARLCLFHGDCDIFAVAYLVVPTS